MKIRITNGTTWSGADLRRLFIACAKWIDTVPCHVTVTYARAYTCSGYAYYNGGPLTLRIPKADGTVHGGQPRDLAPGGEAHPALFAEVAWVIEHEMLHVKGMTHAEMRRLGVPAYKGAWRITEPPPWARGLRLRVKPGAVPKAPVPPAERAAAMVRERAERDAEMLAAWTRKMKLAQTKIRKLRTRIRARERRLAANTARE